MFSTLSEVKLVFLILLQLNILCTRPVKQYYTGGGGEFGVLRRLRINPLKASRKLLLQAVCTITQRNRVTGDPVIWHVAMTWPRKDIRSSAYRR